MDHVGKDEHFVVYEGGFVKVDFGLGGEELSGQGWVLLYVAPEALDNVYGVGEERLNLGFEIATATETGQCFGRVVGEVGAVGVEIECFLALQPEDEFAFCKSVKHGVLCV